VPKGGFAPRCLAARGRCQAPGSTGSAGGGAAEAVEDGFGTDAGLSPEHRLGSEFGLCAEVGSGGTASGATADQLLDHRT
jgi:hypothetical protein